MPNRAPELSWEEGKGGAVTRALTRKAIVEAAIAAADLEGLEAVSIRRVATSLRVQPMTLYSRIASKEDLVALMLNEVSAELLVEEPVPDDWREGLRAIAERALDAYLRHPWMLHAIGQGTRIGPNLLRRAEQLAAVADQASLTGPDGWTVACIMQEWVIGHALHVLRLREDQALEDERPAADADRYPRLTSMSELSRRGAERKWFDRSLDIVLDAIAASARPGASRARRSHRT